MTDEHRKIIAIISNHLETPVTAETHLVDVTDDSLAVIELQLALENALNITIPEETAFETVGDVVEYVSRGNG